MSISIVLMFFMTILEGIRVYMGRSRAEVSTSGAMYSIMADYNSELFKRYHLIALDVDYGGRGEAYLEEKVIDYLEYNLNPPLNNGLYIYEIKDVFLVDYISVTDNNLSNFKKQIKEYIKTEGVIDVTQDLIERVTIGEDGSEVGQDEEDTGDLFDEVEDPRNVIERIMDNGILSYVIPKNVHISTNKIETESIPSNNQIEYGENNILSASDIDISFSNISNINADEELLDFNNILDGLGKEKLEVIIYAMNCFSNYRSSVKYDTVLDYEVEYLITGKDKDYDNLESVANKILFHRYVVNYIDINSNESKKATALVLATALSVITVTEEAIDVYQNIILAAWAYLDSLDDVRDIMSGETIDNLSYEDYLVILLAMSINKDNQYYRMLDLMEINIQQYESDFRIQNCAYIIKVNGYMEFDSRLISNINNQKYIYYFDKEISY